MNALFIFLFIIFCFALTHQSSLKEYRSHQSIEDDTSGPECHCVGYNCGCCAHVTVERIHLNDTVCVNLTYLPKEMGISFTVTIGNKTIYNETISATNPPPICFNVPYLEKLAALCIKFYDLDVTLHKFHGCVRLEARLGHVDIAEYELGCFNIGSQNQPLIPWEVQANSIKVLSV